MSSSEPSLNRSLRNDQRLNHGALETATIETANIAGLTLGTGFKVPVYATTAAVTAYTPADGSIVYDGQAAVFKFRQAGAWVTYTVV